jgi:hypothetical protein
MTEADTKVIEALQSIVTSLEHFVATCDRVLEFYGMPKTETIDKVKTNKGRWP